MTRHPSASWPLVLPGLSLSCSPQTQNNLPSLWIASALPRHILTTHNHVQTAHASRPATPASTPSRAQSIPLLSPKAASQDRGNNDNPVHLPCSALNAFLSCQGR